MTSYLSECDPKIWATKGCNLPATATPSEKAQSSTTQASTMDLVPAHRRLQFQRCEQAARGDALVEDIRDEVTNLSSQQAQLYQLQYQAAQYQKAYVDHRVTSAAQEARSNAEALGLAVNQVHSDQVVLKEHLGAHLKAFEDHWQRQVDNLTQDLSHRQFLALETFDRRIEQLATSTKTNFDQISTMRAGQENMFVSHDQRINDLQTTTARAVQAGDLERWLAQRNEELIASYQKDHRTVTTALAELDERLIAHIAKSLEVKTTRRSPSMEELTRAMQDRHNEALAVQAKSIDDAENRIKTWVRAEIERMPRGEAVRSLEDTVAKHCHSIDILESRTTFGHVTELQKRLEQQHALIHDLQQQIYELDQMCEANVTQAAMDEAIEAWFEKQHTLARIRTLNTVRPVNIQDVPAAVSPLATCPRSDVEPVMRAPDTLDPLNLNQLRNPSIPRSRPLTIRHLCTGSEDNSDEESFTPPSTPVTRSRRAASSYRDDDDEEIPPSIVLRVRSRTTHDDQTEDFNTSNKEGHKEAQPPTYKPLRPAVKEREAASNVAAGHALGSKSTSMTLREARAASQKEVADRVIQRCTELRSREKTRKAKPEKSVAQIGNADREKQRCNEQQDQAKRPRKSKLERAREAEQHRVERMARLRVAELKGRK